MQESKIELTERLRTEGRWSAASKRKDAIIQELRAAKMKRNEASSEAWRRVAEEYPPLPPPEAAPEPSAEPVTGNGQTVNGLVEAIEQATNDITEHVLEEWRQRTGVTLSDEQWDSLIKTVSKTALHFWVEGSEKQIPEMPLEEEEYERLIVYGPMPETACLT